MSIVKPRYGSFMTESVNVRVKMATEKGRAARPSLKVRFKL